MVGEAKAPGRQGIAGGGQGPAGAAARAREPRRAALAGLFMALPLGCGCALLDDSAHRRYQQLVDAPAPPPAAPEVAGPTPDSEEEVAIHHKASLGLLDCLRLAVIRSERLQAEAERVHQVDLEQVSAVGAMLPSATWSFGYFSQDEVVSSPFLPNETRTQRFVLTQPIFRGFRDLYAISAVQDRKALVGAQLRGVKLEIALACGRAFYAVVALERTVETLEHSLELENKRLAEVKAREESGLARKTERLFVETAQARTVADLARSRRDLAAARAQLAYHTGVADAKLDATDVAPLEPGPLERFVETTRDRPDVAALAHEVELHRKEIGIARGELLPSIDAVSDLYAYREGFLQDVRWDFAVNLNWPLFEGFRSLAKIRGAESKVRETERNYADARARARTEVEAAYHAFLASLDQIPALDARVRSAEENVKLLDAEYRAGIASNLEAVDAENTRRQAHLDLERELYNAHRLELELRAASGDESLAPGPYPPSMQDPVAPARPETPGATETPGAPGTAPRGK